MPRWAQYDRANGRIVQITTADPPPPEDKTLAVIEVSAAVRVGDFIGDPEGASEPEQDLTPEAPNPNAPIGQPPPKPKPE